MIYNHPLYPVTIYIYVGLNDKQFAKRLKKDSKGRATDSFIKSMSIECEACVNSYKSHIVMRFNDKKPNRGVIVHETLHATKCIMDYVGISMTDSSEEAWTYTQQNLYNIITTIK